MIARTLIIGCVAVGLCGQWPTWPTTKPKLTGPAPKAADGHPDLSGVWDRGMPAGTPPGQPAPAAGQGPRPFQDLPSMFPGAGLPMLPWAAELRKQRLAENSKDHPDAHCLPLHLVQLHAHPQPRKIVQLPNETLIIYEANDGLRQIFTDGRPLPNANDVQPWWFGYSTGHWDGDTLIVQTTGFRDNGWIDEEGTPITTNGKITERFRRLNYGTLEIEITVDDPKTFSRPWSYRLNQRLMPGAELIEFVCGENNRSLPHLVGR